MRRTHIFALTLCGVIFAHVQGVGAVPAQESAMNEEQQVAPVTDESAQADTAKKTSGYDLTPLPVELRTKVEDYLKEQEKLEKEITRMDAMAQASANQWAQQRATGMATKLNYELKNLRLKRREIIRDYRELLRSGWTPPESMENFESLFFPASESNG